MSFHHDPSGYSGPRLGLGHDSGWSHLAGPSGEGASSMGLDFDQIANDAVDEVFGRRGPVARAVARHPVRAFRATHPRLAANRDYLRAGWGAPGWSAESYYPEPAYYYPEEELTEEEDLDEDEDFGEEVLASEEEYGRRGGGGRGSRPRRPARRAARRQRRQKSERRQAGWGSPSAEPLDASRTPLGFEEAQEEPYWPEEEYEDEEEIFGNDVRLTAPTQQVSTFRTALETGVGLGIGFMGVALGIQLIAQAVSGGRR